LGENGIELADGDNLKMTQIEPSYVSGGRHYSRIWEVMGMIYNLMKEGKTITKRELYYCLVQSKMTSQECDDTIIEVRTFQQKYPS
jgi:DNA topoisomerase VI subunit A